MKQLKDFIRENGYLKKVFATLCVLYGIGFLAIIRANILYRDDIVRAFTGGRYWGSTWSRYGSDILSMLIHTDKTLSDISPLTQIIAILFLALASTLLIHIFYEKKNFSFLTCFAVLPLGLSPYFLECFSFKFDAPYMAASILAAVLPLLFCQYKDTKTLIGYGIACVLCAIFICSTYQVSLGIFPMAIFFLAARRIQNGEKIKEVLKFMGVSAAFYMVGILLFKVFLMRTVDAGYTSNQLLPLKELPSGCFSNLKTYYSVMWEDLKSGWKILMALIFLCYITLFTLKSQTNKMAACLVSVLVLLLCAVLSFPYIIFDKPLLSPRGLYGWGAFLALTALQCCNLSRTPVAKLLTFCLSWCFFSFAFDFGNSLYQQKQWKDFRLQLVVADLNEIMQEENTYILQVSGSIGKAPIIAQKKRHSQILDKLVWDGLYDFCLQNYFGFRNSFLTDESVDLNNLGLPVIKETRYHTIKGDNEHILVLLRE